MRIEPTAENGLQKTSYVMTDKIVIVDKSLLGKRVWVLYDEDMVAEPSIVKNRLENVKITCLPGGFLV